MDSTFFKFYFEKIPPMFNVPFKQVEVPTRTLRSVSLYRKLGGEKGCFFRLFIMTLLRAKIQIEKWILFGNFELNTKEASASFLGNKERKWRPERRVVFSLSDGAQRQWPKAMERTESLKLHNTVIANISPKWKTNIMYFYTEEKGHVKCEQLKMLDYFI